MHIYYTTNDRIVQENNIIVARKVIQYIQYIQSNRGIQTSPMPRFVRVYRLFIYIYTFNFIFFSSFPHFFYGHLVAVNARKALIFLHL